MKNKRKTVKPCGCKNNEYYAKDGKCLLGRTFLSKIKFTKIAVVFLLIIQICLSIAISSKSNIINVSQATKWQSTGKSAVNQTPGKTSKAYENKQAIKIVAEKPQWSNETASVKLQIIGEMSEGANPQYSIDGTDDWKPYKSGEENIITGLKHKQAIAVKMYNESTKITKTSYIHVKDEKEPQKATTTLTSYETTAKSVMNVPVVQTDNESGIDIEKCKWVYNTIETPIGINEADYTGGSFSSNPQTIQVECNTAGNYYLHVLSVDKAGNKAETVFKPIKVSIGAATEGLKQGNIIATAPIWNNGKAGITLNTHTGLNIQWQKNTINGTWVAGNTITDLQHGDSVFARLVDDNGNVGQYASVSILDGNAPNTSSISLSATQTYTDTAITATVTHGDNESGINIQNCKWVYNTISTKIGTNEADYTGGSFNSNPQTINLTANTEGTYYLHVLSVDNAGNKVETISSGVTVNPSYVGYYADIDGDGVIDGIIYADLAIGGEGKWNNDGWSNYQYDAVSKGLKEYSVSKTKAEGPYGERGVITKVEGTRGQDRFYVMALEDINAGTRYCWYYAAYYDGGKLDKLVSTNANDFGSGKENTNYVMEKWEREEWGAKDDNSSCKDLWGAIEEKVKEGWFLPSKSEWSAYGDMMYTKLGMTTSNYNQTFGLSDWYWSSSQRSAILAYYAYFKSRLY